MGFLALVLWAQSAVWQGVEPGSIPFIENKSQWPSSVDAAAIVSGGDIFVSSGQLQFRFFDPAQLEQMHLATHDPEIADVIAINCTIEERVAGILLSGARVVRPRWGEPNATYYNFFCGSDPERWAEGVRSFQQLYYPDVYNGVDWRVYGEGKFLKYDFVVEPGADVGQIQLAYIGTDCISIEDGSIMAQAGFLQWREMQPVAYQMLGDEKKYVRCEFAWRDGNIVFSLPNGYDPCIALTIDPLLIFSTYSGSAADNWGSSATPGEHGTLYSTGVTNHFAGGVFSGTFPATAGSFQVAYGGIFDVALLKYDSLGQNLLYASYLGGSLSESPHSLVVNEQEDLIVLGTTSSTDFPTTATAVDRVFSGGTQEINVIPYEIGSDIFVSRISRDGKHLLGSTYLGGTSNDGLNPSDGDLTANYGDQLRGDVITDAEGSIFISSVTSSSDFPMVDGFDATFGGATDAIIVKLSPDLSSVRWSTYLGGQGLDASHTIKLTNTGIYVGGGTASEDFPTTLDAYQPLFNGGVDGWLARLSTSGNALERATFTGTSSFDQVYFIDVNKDGELFAFGQTDGKMPITEGVYNHPNSGQFLQKFDADLRELVFSTVFGSGRGVPDISPTAFLVNDCNNIYMAGWGGRLNKAAGFWNSDTRGLPVSEDAIQKTSSGADFYFMVLTDDAKEFLYATYLGGPNSATHVDGGTSRFDKGGIVYHAVCSGCNALNLAEMKTSDFPTTPGAWSSVNGSLNCNNAAFKLDLASLRARIQTNNVALNRPNLRVVCLPDPIVLQNTSTGGKIYDWNLGDGTRLTLADTTRIIHYYPEVGTYRISLKATDLGTCIGRDSTTVVVEVSEVKLNVSDDASICFGTSVTLEATGASSYNWKEDRGLFSSTSPSPVVSPQGDTRYLLTASNLKGCVAKDTVNVRVVPGIDLQFEAIRKFSCEGRPSLEVRNLTNFKADEQFLFDFGDGTRSYQEVDYHAYTSDQKYQVKLVAQKEFCVYEAAKEVPVYSIYVPNVITPGEGAGGDAKNDALKITTEGALADPDLQIQLTIYNRWGQLIYKNERYEGNWTGADVQAGVYWYEVKIGKETACKSWLHVIK